MKFFLFALYTISRRFPVKIIKISVRTKIQQILLWLTLVFMPLNIAKTAELRYIYMQFVKMGIIVRNLLLHS